MVNKRALEPCVDNPFALHTLTMYYIHEDEYMSHLVCVSPGTYSFQPSSTHRPLQAL